MIRKKKVCAFATCTANVHSPNCPYKNFQAGEVSIDFSALLKMIAEMEKTVLEQRKREDRQKRKQARIFIAPVLKIKKKRPA